MNEPRIYASSIRYSQKVLDIINSAKGKSFADKFEFIAIDYVEKMEISIKKLQILDKDIRRKSEQYKLLSDRVNMLGKMVNEAEFVVKNLKVINEECNTIIARQLPGSADQVNKNVLQMEVC